MASSRRVLVLDDDDDSRTRLETLLRGAGFDVGTRLLKGALEAVLAETTPSLILVSVSGDPSPGLGVLRSLRSDPRTRERPIVLIVDDDTERQPNTFIHAFEQGADDVLRRPFGAGELIARVGRQHRIRRFVDALEDERNDAQVMLELTQSLASSLDFREILYTVVRRIADVVQVQRVSIVLAPEDEDEDVGYVVVASDDEDLSNLRLDLTKYPEIQQALSTRRPLTISDASTHPVLDEVRAGLDRPELSALSLFPIVWEDQAIGVLFLRAHADRGELSRREMHLCQMVASATAVALRNARVMQSLRDHTQQITFARFEAERRLRQLKRYADLFASAAEGIAVIDGDGYLRFANPRAWEIIGLQENQLRSPRLTDLIHEEDRERARSLWDGFARGEYPRGVDLRIAHQNGDWLVISCSFALLTDDDGSVLVSFQDVTEQRRTEAEFVKTMEFLESLIDASVDGIVAADMDGNILLFNQAAERIYGYRAEEVVGRMVTTELYPEGDAVDVMRRLKSDQFGGPGRLSPTNIHALAANGELVPIRLSAAMIYERGEPVATFGIFTDLREKLRVEERLAEAQQRLASTERQALLAELAGTAAHELNQPLTSVMAYAELLKRKLEEGTAEHRAAGIMVREVERMAEIVKKIGKMTKYETTSYVGRQKILDLDAASNETTSDVGGVSEEL